MKNKAELTALKEEVETESKKQHELNDEELVQVSGGAKAVQDETQGKRKGQALIRESAGECGTQSATGTKCNADPGERR